jgi:hypothetical protein
MRILYVADGRSPTALNWMRHFIDSSDYEVHLASTHECPPVKGVASQHVVPVAFSRAAGQGSSIGSGVRTLLGARARAWLRDWLGPLTVPRASGKLSQLYQELQPDLVHALRIPYEGMLAARANPPMPLLVSVWGNDFTLHARANPLMAGATFRTLRRADALHSDTQRDVELAGRWGFQAGKPSFVAPGNGGIRKDIFYPMPHATEVDVTEARLAVINPRGIRAYVRNDTFFKAVPLVLRKRPEVRFFCPSMEGQSEAEDWVDELKIRDYVALMPRLGQRALADAYHSAQVMVSPSTHDGTPNTLLEAMACGCFPVLGDIESVREWVTDGENGLLVDPRDPLALATAIIQALKDHKLRARAAEINQRLIAERADHRTVMQQVEAFYSRLVS